MKKLVLLLLLPFFYIDSKDKTITVKRQTTQTTVSNSIIYNKEIESYKIEINRAVALLKNQKQLIDLELDQKERINILSVAFPEIIRYNAFSDYIEASSNRVVYINRGKKYSDFSTGYFQMKPSFVEDLENYIKGNQDLQHYNSILIRNKKEKEAREKRIDRLENFQWQLRYLKIFWHIAEYKYKNISFKTKSDKIRFYATAYNYGFTKPDKEILEYQTLKIFPYGGKSSMKKVAFADFSIDFIKNYSSQFN